MTLAEIKVVQPQAKGRLELPEAEEARKGSLLQASDGAWSC